MSFSLPVALVALLSKWLFMLSVSTFTCIYDNIHDKARRFYIGLYCPPGNLGKRSVTISTLFLFILLVTSIIRACMRWCGSNCAVIVCD